jgi:ribonucleotide reductase beta subunit family protein with ferritin-like domain
MAQNELLALAKRIHALMSKLTDDEERYYDEIAAELGGEDELQNALLATAIVEGLIKPTAALAPILQEIEEKLLEIVEA